MYEDSPSYTIADIGPSMIEFVEHVDQDSQYEVLYECHKY